jgi:hypothetical protein
MFKSLIALFICIKLVLSSDISSCAKYQCQSPGKNETCVYIAAGPKRGLDHDEISLFDTCQDNQFCNTTNINLLSWMENDATFECDQISFKKPRYPGEDCDQDQDCNGPQFGPYKCDQATKKCAGSNEGEKCDWHDNCIVGLYCDEGTSICTKQQPRGGVCYDSFQCENALLCYNDTCSITPFSLPSGVEVPSDSRLSVYHSYQFCNRMEAYQDDQSVAICAEITQSVPAGEEYIKCNFGDECSYMIGETDEYTQDCECGANANGQGYCPQGQNLSKYKL